MEQEIYLKSDRGTEIHTYINSADQKSGLLVFAHSFKGEANEDGRFEKLAKLLESIYVSSIRMEFPGSINSLEDDSTYSLSNCLADMEVCASYMLDNYDIDTEHLALLGYSMGGRLVSLFNMKHPEFKTMVLWAPCCKIFELSDSFLEQPLVSLKKQADEKGYIDFYDIYNDKNTVFPKEFVADLLDGRIEEFIKFNGNILIIHGDKDTTVPLEESKKLYDSLQNCEDKKLKIIKGADHGFGLWDQRIEDSEELIMSSFGYLKKHI